MNDPTLPTAFHPSPRAGAAPSRRLGRPAAWLTGLIAAAVLAGCAGIRLPGAAPAVDPTKRREVAVAVTVSNQLISFNAGRPGVLLWKRPLKGLQPGETLLGIDYRVKNDTLYGLGSYGQLYTVDTDTGEVAPVGGRLPIALDGTEFGFDFNPTVDRIRVASSSGQNLRLHPDTGAVVDALPDQPGLQIDGRLTFDDADRHVGRAARVVGAAYSYNKDNPKITTNFAIDQATASLVTQGTREGVSPAVSPNTGRLLTVGPLNVGPFDTAAFDIHVLTDLGFVALSGRSGQVSRWVEVDLKTGAGRIIGTIAGGEAVRAIALESW